MPVISRPSSNPARGREVNQQQAPAPYHGAPSVVDVLLASRADDGLSATAALVLVHVAAYASGCAGACWAAVATLAAACHCSTRTVQRALRELVDRGWLLEVHERGRSTTYRVRVERVRAPGVAPEPAVRSTRVRASDDPLQLDLFAGGVTQSQGGGDTVSPDQISDQTIQAPPLAPPAGGDQSEPTLDGLDPLEALEVLAALDERPPVVEPLVEPPVVELRLARAREVVEALVAPMVLDLDALPPREVEPALAAYRSGAPWLVDRWVAATRGRRTIDGLRRDVVAPDGVRRRYVVRALQLAAERWGQR